MQNKELKLTVVIPCYNEEKTIEQVVKAVKASKVSKKEIIIVDDCSTDKTKEILKKKLSKEVDKVIYHEHNTGKGGALKTGFAAATGDIVIVQDADLEYDPAEHPKLVEIFMKHPDADVVLGSRFLFGAEGHRLVSFWHTFFNNVMNFWAKMFTDVNLTDVHTCYKSFRRPVIQSIDIQEKRFGADPEMIMKVARKKCVFYEVGISYKKRTAEEGKHIGLKDAFRFFYCVVRYSLFN